MLLKAESCVRRVGLLTATLAALIVAVRNSAAPDPTNSPLFSRPGWIVDGKLKAFGQIEQNWKNGQTNLPFVGIEWFGSHDIVFVSSVSQEGAVRNGSFDELGGKGWRGIQKLDGTNLNTLKTLIDLLPPSARGSIPGTRRILVYGTRSNSWYAFTYDRADVPWELEQICDLTGGRIDWVVPSTRLTTNLVIQGGGDVQRLTTAASAPVAVASVLWGEAEIWDLQKGQGTRIAPFQHWWKLVSRESGGTLSTNAFMSSGGSIAVSGAGTLVVVGAWDSVFALDLPVTMPLTPRWLKRKGGDYERQTWSRQLAVLDGGECLAVALTDGIERWSLHTGEPLSVLSTNTVPVGNGGVLSMLASRDGKVLVAELGGGLLEVWRSPWTNTPQQLKEHPWVRLMEISPEGRYLALHAFGRLGQRLVVCDLNNGTRKDMPFRGCFKHEAWFAAWSPDGRFLAVTGCGQWPCLYDTSTWKPVLLWQVPSNGQYWSGGPCGRLAFAADGMLLANFGDGALRGLRFPVSPNALEWDVPADN